MAITISLDRYNLVRRIKNKRISYFYTFLNKTDSVYVFTSVIHDILYQSNQILVKKRNKLWKRYRNNNRIREQIFERKCTGFKKFIWNGWDEIIVSRKRQYEEFIKEY